VPPQFSIIMLDRTRGLRHSPLFGGFSSLKLRAWNALSSLSFNLNAMTSVSAMMMPEREQAVLLKAMRSLWEGSLQNGASKRLFF
jgi:hypothetical protein